VADFFFENFCSHSGAQQTAATQQASAPKPVFSQQVMQVGSKACTWSCLQHQQPRQQHSIPKPKQQISNTLHHQQSQIRVWHIPFLLTTRDYSLLSHFTLP
jgi:hypothetical protein